MGAEPKQWSVLVQRCWGASPCAAGLGKAQPSSLSLLQFFCKRRGDSTMSQSTKTLPKITGVFQPVSVGPQCGMPLWDCLPWAAN